MPVSPSFSTYPVISKEPFVKDAKYYVTIVNPKTGTERDVRYYNEQEYARTYGNKLIDTTKTYTNLKKDYGFHKGPILLIRGIKLQDTQYLRTFAKCSYETGLGWYVPSDGVLPTNVPSHFKYLILAWKEFSIDDYHIRKPSEIAKTINNKILNKKWVEFND